MKFLVTGGAGFIGHQVVAGLESLGHECYIFDNCTDYGYLDANELSLIQSQRLALLKSERQRADIRSSLVVSDIFEKFQPNAVIHLASYPRQRAVDQSPAEASDVMSTGLIHLLEKSKSQGISRFVYVSSSMVYGDFPDGADETHPCRPQGIYGILKLAGEDLVRDYARRNCFSHTVIRPSAVYGERDVTDRVISKFFVKALRNEQITVRGVNEILDFTHVNDLAHGIVQAALSPMAENKTYNITRSDDRPCTLLDAAEKVVALVGQGQITVDTRDEKFPQRGRLNIQQAHHDFGYTPKNNLEQGLQQCYDWYKDNTFLWNF